MIWKIDDTSLPNYFRVTLEGDSRPEDYAAFWSEVISHQNWKPGTPVLVDGTNRSPYGERTSSIIKTVTDFFSTHINEFGDSSVASIIKPKEFNQFERAVEYSVRLRGSQAILRYFTSEPEATEWLKNISLTRGYPTS